MKVFVIFERDGWEMLGIKKIFLKREGAVKYLEQGRESIEAIGIPFDKHCNNEIHEQEIEE